MWHSTHQARENDELHHNRRSWGFDTPSHQKTSKTHCPTLCLELHGTLIGSFRAASLLTTIDHIESMPATAKRCPCWISDHQTLAINLAHSSTLLSHFHYCRRASVVDSRFSRNRHVRGPVFAWEASRTLATSRETTPPRDLCDFSSPLFSPGVTPP